MKRTEMTVLLVTALFAVGCASDPAPGDQQARQNLAGEHARACAESEAGDGTYNCVYLMSRGCGLQTHAAVATPAPTDEEAEFLDFAANAQEDWLAYCQRAGVEAAQCECILHAVNVECKTDGAAIFDECGVNNRTL